MAKLRSSILLLTALFFFGCSYSAAKSENYITIKEISLRIHLMSHHFTIVHMSIFVWTVDLLL